MTDAPERDALVVPVPLLSLLFQKMLLDTVAELPEALAIPPPVDPPLLLKKAELPEKVQLVIIGAEMTGVWLMSKVVVLYIPPPEVPAELPENMQLTSEGEDPWLNIPPPA